MKEKKKTPLRHSIKALLQGYVWFAVDTTCKTTFGCITTKTFWAYHQARDYRLTCKEYVNFYGFSVIEFVKDLFDKRILKKGIRCFYWMGTVGTV
jgi:hypothetical protein